MSREALSLEISQVVSRVVSGEPIDTAERGLMLALKYPELGMSGEMIGAAIVRAANMVGMIKSAPMPAAWPDDRGTAGRNRRRARQRRERRARRAATGPRAVGRRRSRIRHRRRDRQPSVGESRRASRRRRRRSGPCPDGTRRRQNAALRSARRAPPRFLPALSSRKARLPGLRIRAIEPAPGQRGNLICSTILPESASSSPERARE